MKANTALKLVLFLVSLLVPLWLLSIVAHRKAKAIYVEKPSYVISAKGLSFDYVVGGSSRAHNNFNTLLFDSASGKKGFNIGYDGSGMAQVYLTLYFFLKNGNHASYYFQQVEDKFLSDPTKSLVYPFQEYFFMPYLGEPEVDACFKSNVPAAKYYLWKYVPYMRYAEFNNYYGPAKWLKQPGVDPKMLRDKGYAKLTDAHKPGFPAKAYTAGAESGPDDRNMQYLEKIAQLCRAHGMTFVIYSSPVYDRYAASIRTTTLHKALLDFTAQHGIAYVDLMHDEAYKGEALFYDETHLNAAGTDRFTLQLADSVKKLMAPATGALAKVN